MIVLGIDPGYAIVGIGVVQCVNGKFKSLYHQAIKTSSKQLFPARLNCIFKDLTIILNRYKPDIVAIESLFFNTNTSTAIQVAQARGVMLLACELQGIKTLSFTPLQVKTAVCGQGTATKKQVQYMVKHLFAFVKAPSLDDITDALALAVCGFYETKYKTKLVV